MVQEEAKLLDHLKMSMETDGTRGQTFTDQTMILTLLTIGIIYTPT